MTRLILALALLMAAADAHAGGYLGSWKIDDLATFTVTTHATTGASTDADDVPAYRVYENETGTAILTGSMAKLDDSNTTGYYSEQVTLSAANGFEKGKSYSIIVSAAVGGTSGATTFHFQIEAEVDANIVSDPVTIEDGTGTGQIDTNGGAVVSVTTTATATNLTNLPTIPANWITAAGVAADAITDSEFSVTSDVIRTDVRQWLGTNVTTAVNGYPRVDLHYYAGNPVATSATNFIPVDVMGWNGTTVPAEDTAGYPKVTIKDGTGTGEVDTASGRVAVTESQVDQVVNETWDELKADHTTPNSFGDFLDDEISAVSGGGGGGLDLDEALASHTTAGTLGALMNLVEDKLPSGALAGAGGTHNDLDDVVDATEAAIEAIDLEAATTPVSQVAVPEARTWILAPSNLGMTSDVARGLRIDEEQTFAVDFKADLPTNGKVVDIVSVEIAAGEAGGVTIDDEGWGVDRSLAKLPITAVEADEYTLRVTVEYHSADGSGTAVGLVELDVTE
jgi:hypothetical protein